MSRRSPAVLALAAGAAATAVLAGTGCGGTKSSGPASASSGASGPASTASYNPARPLTRAELIAKADTICYGIKAEGTSKTIATQEQYVHFLPVYAAYYRNAVAQMQRLTPPASMAKDWKQMVAAAETFAKLVTNGAADIKARGFHLSPSLHAAGSDVIHRMTAIAKRDGFKDCVQR